MMGKIGFECARVIAEENALGAGCHVSQRSCDGKGEGDGGGCERCWGGGRVGNLWGGVTDEEASDDKGTRGSW